MPDLEELGWDDRWRSAFDEQGTADSRPGRIAVPHRGAYDVLTARGLERAHVAPRFRREAARDEFPVVGDWVVLGDPAEIEGVLPRRTVFARRAPADSGGADRPQVIASNIDVVFVAVPVASELEPLLVERYAALAHESGARPVILRTKADLATRPAPLDVAGDIPVELVSTRTGQGLERVRAHLGRGVTGTLVGPSGAGKSTLVNALVGDDALPTGAVRDDGSGRHTTTRRELVLVPGGGVLIDNPGMRQVQLWLLEDGVEGSFPEIEELAAECRFPDCRHETEPGCAVREAVAENRLTAERLERYVALRDELEQLEERLRRNERARPRRRS